MQTKPFLCGITLACATLAAQGAAAPLAAPPAAPRPAVSAPSAEPAPEAVQAAIDKGVAWLTARQQADGSWSNPNYPALTALGLWALARTGRGDAADACRKAAAFVAGFAQPDGGIYKPATGGRGSGGLSTYNTAICMTALHAADRAAYAPIILKARTFVAHSQLQGDSAGAGGFGYEGGGTAAPRDRADLSNTGWALAAMRLTQDLEDLRPAGGKKADVDWSAALAFVEKLQNRDAADTANHGGFGYEAGGARGGAAEGASGGAVTLRGFGSMTYAGLESMIYAQVGRDDPRVRSAIAWAARHWSVDENPGMGSKGLYYYYTIMAKALLLAGGDTLPGETGAPIPWKQDLTAKLLREQKPDGSWANSDNTFWEGDPMLVTAYSLLTLGMMQ